MFVDSWLNQLKMRLNECYSTVKSHWIYIYLLSKLFLCTYFFLFKLTCASKKNPFYRFFHFTLFLFENLGINNQIVFYFKIFVFFYTFPFFVPNCSRFFYFYYNEQFYKKKFKYFMNLCIYFKTKYMSAVKDIAIWNRD